jgi:hypothetical protein
VEVCLAVTAGVLTFAALVVPSKKMPLPKLDVVVPPMRSGAPLKLLAHI